MAEINQDLSNKRRKIIINLTQKNKDITINTSSGIDVVEAKYHSSLLGLDYESSGHTGFASSTQLEAETTRATEAENNLDTKIIEETTRAQNAESEVDTKINSEIARATQVETQLAADISTETSRAETAETELDTKITNETTRAESAENTISTSVTNLTQSLEDEVTRAKSAEEANTTLINEHKEDKNNPHNVTKEQIGLDKVDNTSDIDKPVSTAQAAAIKEVQDNLDSEVSTRESEDVRVLAEAEHYADEFGGRINTIKVNGATQEIVDKTVDITMPTKLSELENDNYTVEDANYKHITVTSSSVSDGENTFNQYDDTSLKNRVTTIENDIPSQASSTNQLADKDFVNSSISTNTATYRGNYNLINDLHLSVSATKEEIAAALKEKILVYTNNDYCFVEIPVAQETPTTIANVQRYKYVSATSLWTYEYTLNNSSFTASQWNAINSGVTSTTVKADAEHIANTDIHVTTENKATWNAKYDKPSTGIPKSDLATDIQTSLSKADSAVQDSKYVHTDNNYTTEEKNKLASLHNYDDSEVKASITAEETRARAAENALSSDITTEATERKSEDSKLSTSISTETNRATAAENKLTTDLGTESSTRMQADVTLQNDIINETNARSSADTALSTRITTIEGDYLKDEDKVELNTKISDEQTRALAAENSIDSNIQKEIVDRTAATEELNLKLVEERTTRTSVDLDLAARIKTIEEDYLTSEDKTELQQSISAETQARSEADTEINKKINAITADYLKSSDKQELQNNIDSEAATREANDIQLQANIDAEAASRSSEHSALNTKIENETYNRTTADTALSNRITKIENDYLTSDDKEELEGEISDENVRASLAETALSNRVTTIENEIPSEASSTNQLADKDFVNSSIATNTATFRGTYNVVTDLGLTVDATNDQIAAALLTKITTVTNNDYSYAVIPQSAETPDTAKEYRRFKYNATSKVWVYEYTLNNSSFTATQWAAINSGINSTYKASYDSHLTNKSNPHGVTAEQVGLGNVENKTLDKTVTENSGNYITSGAVQKYVTDNLYDDKVILSADVYTNYNVGKVTTASGTNPVKVGSSGETIKQLFENIFKMDELQPTKTDPSLSVSFASSASDEYGTSITSLTYTITTNDGKYTYDSSTGVSWTSYTVNGGSSVTSKTGTIAVSYTVGTSSALTIPATGTHTAGNVAKTNLGNNSNPVVQIAAGTKSTSGTFSKTSVNYPYYASSTTTSTPTSGTKGSTNIESTSGATVSYITGNYLWLFSTTENSSKKIQIYSDLAKAWDNMLEDTVYAGAVTFTQANGVKRTFYAYRTKNVSQSTGSATIRLN